MSNSYVWYRPSEGGYLYQDNLSERLRMDLLPLCKLRQFAAVKPDESEFGLNRGDTFHWDIISPLARRGTKLAEDQRMPRTSGTVRQGSLTVTEYGNSTGYSGKLTSMAKFKLEEIVDKQLRIDAQQVMDLEVHEQLENCAVRVVPASGTSTTAIEVTTNGVPAQTNNVAFGKIHARRISTEMREANVPAFVGDDYVALSHPSTFENMKGELESVHQYVSMGLEMIFSGEMGRFESIRFVDQTFIPKGGAADSTTFDPYTSVADPWNNGKSSWIYFFGDDTVAEAVVYPEEIRASIPDDFGRSKAIAWYALSGFGIVHDDATNCRIWKWDSAA